MREAGHTALTQHCPLKKKIELKEAHFLNLWIQAITGTNSASAVSGIQEPTSRTSQWLLSAV